jgi:bifunctional non-homologous end joining protein LigD
MVSGGGAGAAGRQPRQALRRALARLGAPRAEVAIETIVPMQPEVSARPFTAAGWLFELKYDGYRVLVERSVTGAVRLLYRSGRDATPLFPELARAVAALPFAPLVLDGEAVALDAAGRPSFGLLQGRMPLGGAAWRPGRAAPRAARAGTGMQAAGAGLTGGEPAVAPVALFVFDLLACEGFDLRPLPLAARQSALRQVMAAADPQGPLRRVEMVEARGEDLFAAVVELGLEGIVAKRAASPYRAGRSADWLKVRADRVGDFAIVGYGPRAPADLRRLHLAVRAAGGWRYAGSVGSGLAAGVRAALRARLGAARPTAPAAVGVSASAARADRLSEWIEPELVCEVRYKEWTAAGSLRQPVFLRLRDDKRATDCEALEALEPPGAAAK